MLKRSYAVALLTALLIFAPAALSATLKFEVDAAHSHVGFSIPTWGGLSKVGGKFNDFAVTIVYDEADVTKSSVNAVIKAASIDTGIERRDAHLRTADFFDTEKYPEITFTSTRIEKKGKQLIAHGNFTMHGVTKEIALPFTIVDVRKDAKTGKTQLGVVARLVINRRDYGITFSRPDNPTFLGEQVEIELDLATRPVGPPAAAAASGN